MQFSTLIFTLVTLGFATAEPIPADVGLGSEPLVVRNILMHPRAEMVSCCVANFKGNCDCGSCPITQCAVSILIQVESKPRGGSGAVANKTAQKKYGGRGCKC
ncbi:hypothetical protein PpBr36_05459 [Pyricularia pennisetigena]|uniref:hypothetical protein n=1 Tax=Pyricularia pennisetigena TaxID=1578925 RepID=UPI001150A67F|nr:hypothetical protein PpBr36_05459 [Pyricularia pennisetigena]TLS26671.1 hypothetical protein PpBr36_05459 [Pyricularia pennisetigena]